MLRNTNELLHYAIQASDGHIGCIRDFYFDDHRWVIRYLVVDTGGWLPDRKVLISPMSVIHADAQDKMIDLSITKDRVEHSPDIDTDKPISQQQEQGYLGYYGYPYYWGGAGLWGARTVPYAVMGGTGGGTDAQFAAILAQDQREQANAINHDDPHLRSCKTVVGYRINAIDGDIGHVKSMLIDEDTWAIRYLIVETGQWWHGHEVLIVPKWIRAVSWADRSVSVDITRAAVKDAPLHATDSAVERQHEIGMHDHYGRTGYWEQEALLEKSAALL